MPAHAPDPPAHCLPRGDYRATYERELAKIRTNDAAVIAADAAYLKALDTLLAACKKQGDFEATTVAIEERKRFEACKMVPDTPATNTLSAVAKLQRDYRTFVMQAEAERDQRVARLLRSYTVALRT